jgi:hypothetical protein
MAFSASARGAQALSLVHLGGAFGMGNQQKEPEPVDLRPVALLGLELGSGLVVIKTR